MTTSELISYIRKQINNNISRDLIISKLIEVGWHREDIDEGFLSVDQYREPLEGDNLFEAKKELPKMKVFNIENPVTETLKVENPIIEIPKVETPVVETPKVWTPMKVPIIEKSQVEVSDLDLKTETTKIAIQNLELSPLQGISHAYGRPPEGIGRRETTQKEETKSEELLPTLMPKAVVDSFGSINRANLIKTEDDTIVSNETPKSYLINNLPKIAMLSSYKNDLLSATKIKEEIVKKKGFKTIKWVIVALVVILISLAVWVFASGYINIKNLNLPFIKKDPRVLLLNNSKVLSSLKSYKTETNIEILSPSFANIASGLISGEAIPSPDKDSISINVLGLINKNGQGVFSDNFVTIKGSLLPDYITTDIKNNSLDLFISIPDLSQVINENAPEPTVVKINEQQFELVPPLFSPNIELQLKKINIYKILSSGMPSYINNDTLSVYDEFINSVDIVAKGQENIKGIDTYHYSINTDRQLAKNLLNKISDNFILNLSGDDKDNLAQILGSITIDSLEIWVGKGDNNIYQYNVVLDVPLSKIIGFEDRSIGDNQLRITWKTTYYDFNISNNISIPDTSTAITDFVNGVKETKIKNDVSSFKQLATSLFNAEGAYGKKSNSSGSCMNPSSGSLFSPTGHIKGVTTTTAVSSISILLNKVLGTTGGAGFCYSTPKAWSFTIPISDNYAQASIPVGGYTSFFCIDSTGSIQDLTTPPTGVVCLPKVNLPKEGN